MCAYIRAKGKGGKNFKITVEDKHKYHNYNDETIVMYKTDPLADDAFITGAGYAIGYDDTAGLGNFVFYDLSYAVSISQGTGEGQRIGNKVFMKYLNFTYSINFDGNTFINRLPQGTINDSFYRFRTMIVRFDSDEAITGGYIRDWFRDTFTYFRSVNLGGGSQLVFQSVHTKRKRESTAYTGRFEILYDKMFKMGKKKVVKMSSVPIAINQNINFDPSTGQITDDNFKNIYAIVIGPCNSYLDMDCISQDKTLNFSTSYYGPFTVNAVLKYEWYDM